MVYFDISPSDGSWLKLTKFLYIYISLLCACVGEGVYATQLRHLTTLQNEIVKLIAGVPSQTNVDAL